MSRIGERVVALEKESEHHEHRLGEAEGLMKETTLAVSECGKIAAVHTSQIDILMKCVFGLAGISATAIAMTVATLVLRA